MADGECNYVLYDKPEAVVNIRIQNLLCASHVEHMDHRRIARRLFKDDMKLICCLVSEIGGRSRSRENFGSPTSDFSVIEEDESY